MKPILLQGHDRSITQIKYNREGDLLFTCSKDSVPNVWWGANGERLGTYNGHQGAVWCLDVDWTSTRLMTGSGDMTTKLWDVERGSIIASIGCKSAIRTCQFSFSGNQAAYSTDAQMGQSCSLNIIDVREADASLSQAEATLRIPVPQSKITSLLWGPVDETIISGHENGQISIWDLRMGKEVNSVNDHTHQINDMQPSKEGTMFVTASKDCTAKLFDSESLMCLKTYKTERPVNSASISPILDHVVLGGGQDAMEVTTTSTRVGKFDARFFYMIYEEEFGRVKGHFGPINSIVFSPDGKSFASGGEDGFVRVQVFDNNYFDFTTE